MTLEDVKEIGILVDESSNLLYFESGFEWLLNNTSLEFNIDDIESLKSLPSSAKLFISKYACIIANDFLVTSESVGDMSQNFNQKDIKLLISDLAKSLLNEYIKPNVNVFRVKRKWNY